MDFAAEFRHALRRQLRRPGPGLLIVLSLGLGIGATATAGSIAYSVLLHPLPFRSPERLVVVGEVLKANPEQWRSSSYPNYLEWKTRSHVFASMAASRAWNPALRLPAESFRAQGAEVSADFLALLGLKTRLGHSFAPQDFRPGAEPVAILSHQLWHQRFGADVNLIGRALRIDGKSRTVVGVLAPGGVLDEPVVIGAAELLAPLIVSPSDPFAARGFRAFRVIARLRTGATPQRAEKEMHSLAKRLSAEHPETNRDTGVRLEPLREILIASSRPPLLALLGAAALVLLISCANAANMLLVQLTGRRRELAVRSALGADRTELFRQLLIESLPCVVLAASLGLVLTRWAWSSFVALLPQPVLSLSGLRLDARVLAVTFAVSVLALALVDSLPFLELSRTSLKAALGGGGAGSGDPRSSGRLRDLLVALELALSLALLIGAGLLVQTLVRLSRVDLGFHPEHLVAFGLDLSSSGSADRANAFFATLLRDLEGQPGIRSASVVVNLPLKQGANMSTGVGLVPGAYLDWPIDLNGVAPGYFAALGIPLLAGRDFEPREIADDSSAVVILSSKAATRLWPGGSALGRRVILDWMNPIPREVIAVVGDLREVSPGEPPHPEAYLPYPQLFFGSANLVIRTSLDPRSIARNLRRRVHALDSGILVSGTIRYEELVAAKIASPLTDARVLTSYAVAGILLAAIGVYGVTAFAVGKRRREIGLRMALGAQRRDVVWSILERRAPWLCLGLLLGVGVGYLMSRLLASLLFEVRSLDGWTYAAMLLLLAAVALGATCLPALEATRVDPLRVLNEG